MEQLIKILAILILAYSAEVHAQIDKHFFLTKDTINIENPVIISEVNRDGLFVVDNKHLKVGERVNLKKMLNEGKAFVFSTEIYIFLSLKELHNKKNKYNECNYIEIYNFDEKIIIRKLPYNIKKFIVGFVETKFYNRLVITVDKGKTIFNDKRDFQYKIILFPICME